MKKLLILLIVALCTPIASRAQSFVGSWDLYPCAAAPTKVVETPDFIYTLSGTSLTVMDKETRELQTLNSANRLNGINVQNIWYDPRGKFLLVAYTDSNIDLIYDSGKVINVPDLRDAPISLNKTINDADFRNGRAYVALECGFLVIDATHGAILESNLFNQRVSSIAVTDDFLTFAIYNDAYYYLAPLSGPHRSFPGDYTKYSGSKNVTSFHGLTGNLVVNSNKQNVLIYDLAPATPTRSFEFTSTTNRLTANGITPTKNGYMVSCTDGTVVYISPDGKATNIGVINEVNGNLAADWSGTGKQLVIGSAKGTGIYDTQTGAYTQQPQMAQGTSGTNVGLIYPLPSGKILLTTADYSHYSSILNCVSNQQVHADIFDPKAGVFSALDVSLFPAKKPWGMSLNEQDNSMFITNHDNTAIRFVNIDKQTYRQILHTELADLVGSDYAPRDFEVDKFGTLWVLSLYNNLRIVKAPKGSWESDECFDPTKWYCATVEDLGGTHSSAIKVDNEKENLLITGKSLAICKLNPGKGLASSDFVNVNSEKDEDGATLDEPYIWADPTIDKNGWIWLPNNMGVCVIKDSDEAFNPNFRVHRPKVPRNDGTDLADYLLSQVQCSAVGVDANNEKWIATIGSGLYHVSADGTEILEHIEASSSQMPSDEIFLAVPSPTSNDVYIGYASGLAVYHSGSSPAAESYDDVLAYPNPVTPDYAGHVTITGLMANSLVKITDAAGNVVHETMSNGGMAQWNGCDSTGRRVRSGVYFVFASQSGENENKAAVTKIVVVN